MVGSKTGGSNGPGRQQLGQMLKEGDRASHGPKTSRSAMVTEEEEGDGEVTTEFLYSVCLRASHFVWTGIARSV
jgi:hypothetical protein